MSVIPRSSSPGASAKSAGLGSASGAAPPKGNGAGVPQQASPVDPRIGSRLGKYKILSILGRGGMGAVYEAEDQILQRRVAVKLLSGPMAADSEMTAMFLREARAAARLTHPNTVTIHEIDRRDGQVYIVMELVRGGSAADRLRRHGPFDWPTATRLIADVCRALAAAHAAGLVHRDVKPANVMHGDEGVVKLADFGLAKVQEREDSIPRLHSQGEAPKHPGGQASLAAAAVGGQPLTWMGLGAGQTLNTITGGSRYASGTPQYMSPEQCLCEPLDGRSDLYSLGATYYTLLTATSPYAHFGEPEAVMMAQVQQPLPDVRQANPAVPAEVAAVIARAMAKAPAERYPNAADMLADLEALLRLPIAVENTQHSWANQGVTLAAIPSLGGASHQAKAANLADGSLRFWARQSATMAELFSAQTAPLSLGVIIASVVLAAVLALWAFSPDKSPDDPYADKFSRYGSHDDATLAPKVPSDAPPRGPSSPLGTAANGPTPPRLPSRPNDTTNPPDNKPAALSWGSIDDPAVVFAWRDALTPPHKLANGTVCQLAVYNTKTRTPDPSAKLPLDNRGRLVLPGDGMALIGEPRLAAHIESTCRAANALTIEALISCHTLTLSGPARIISLSMSHTQRCFTLGQEGDKLVLRLNTSVNDANGTPALELATIPNTKRECHLLVSYAKGELQCWFNGKPQTLKPLLPGDFSKWPTNQALMFGDETHGERPWKGTLRGVVIMARAVDASEARRRYDATRDLLHARPESPP